MSAVYARPPEIRATSRLSTGSGGTGRVTVVPSARVTLIVPAAVPSVTV